MGQKALPDCVLEAGAPHSLQKLSVGNVVLLFVVHLSWQVHVVLLAQQSRVYSCHDVDEHVGKGNGLGNYQVTPGLRTW